jgi:hypothetical protein
LLPGSTQSAGKVGEAEQAETANVASKTVRRRRAFFIVRSSVGDGVRQR